jgi:hypothetical protein
LPLQASSLRDSSTILQSSEIRGINKGEACQAAAQGAAQVHRFDAGYQIVLQYEAMDCNYSIASGLPVEAQQTARTSSSFMLLLLLSGRWMQSSRATAVAEAFNL